MSHQGMAPKPFIWHLRVHPDVLDAISKRPDAERMACLELVKALRLNPRSRQLGVLPVKGIGLPSVYSAPIGRAPHFFGLLTYQIYADQPAIHLFQVRFWD